MNFTLALIRDYMLECAKEFKWKEESFEFLGSIGTTRETSYAGRFSRRTGSSIYAQDMNWTFRGEIIRLRKTSTDGIFYEEEFTANLCDPESLEKIKNYFIY